MIKVSHTSLSYLSCMRKYELGYIEGLQRKVTQESRSLILGQIFHAGVAAALLHVYNGGLLGSLEAAAIMGARKAFSESLIENKTINVNGVDVLDQAYYGMMNDIQANVESMLRHYLPSVGIGIRYRVVNTAEFPTLNVGDSLPVPIVEWEFRVPLIVENGTTEIELHGFIDALLYDMEEERYVLVDWKTRAPNAMVKDEMAMLDGQLHLYASVLDQLGVSIDTICMHQFSTVTPKPAELKKDGLPSIAACRSTWEVWYSSLPDPARKHVDKDWTFWYDDFRVNKLATADAFIYAVYATINEDSNASAWDNAQAQAGLATLVRMLVEDDRPVPANMSAHGCRSCPFKMLCVQPLRYNEPTEEYVAMYYERRDGYGRHEGEDEV